MQCPICSEMGHGPRKCSQGNDASAKHENDAPTTGSGGYGGENDTSEKVEVQGGWNTAASGEAW